MKELTPEEQAQYKVLQMAVQYASHAVGQRNNDTTRAAYDKAIADIMAFEAEHTTPPA